MMVVNWSPTPPRANDTQRLTGVFARISLGWPKNGGAEHPPPQPGRRPFVPTDRVYGDSF